MIIYISYNTLCTNINPTITHATGTLLAQLMGTDLWWCFHMFPQLPRRAAAVHPHSSLDTKKISGNIGIYIY